MDITKVGDLCPPITFQGVPINACSHALADRFARFAGLRDVQHHILDLRLVHRGAIHVVQTSSYRRQLHGRHGKTCREPRLEVSDNQNLVL